MQTISRDMYLSLMYKRHLYQDISKLAPGSNILLVSSTNNKNAKHYMTNNCILLETYITNSTKNETSSIKTVVAIIKHEILGILEIPFYESLKGYYDNRMKHRKQRLFITNP